MNFHARDVKWPIKWWQLSEENYKMCKFAIVDDIKYKTHIFSSF